MNDVLFLLVVIAGFGGFLALVSACDHIVRSTGVAARDDEVTR